MQTLQIIKGNTLPQLVLDGQMVDFWYVQSYKILAGKTTLHSDIIQRKSLETHTKKIANDQNKLENWSTEMYLLKIGEVGGWKGSLGH